MRAAPGGGVGWRTSSALRFCGEHGAQGAPAKNVDVEVGDFLVAVGAGVGQDAVARGFETQQFGNVGDGAEEAGDLFLRGGGGEIGQRDAGGFWNDQNMYRRLGIDVVEREANSFSNTVLFGISPRRMRAKMLFGSYGPRPPTGMDVLLRVFLWWTRLPPWRAWRLFRQCRTRLRAVPARPRRQMGAGRRTPIGLKDGR